MQERRTPHTPKHAPQPSGQDTHPETKRHERARVPDDKSSKVAPDKRRDERSGNDKDGNEQQVTPRSGAR